MTENSASHNTPTSAETPLHIRAIGKGWLWIDNAVYDRYAAALGLEGLGLYVALARYANNTTAQCWPSLSRLATEMGTEIPMLEIALERLIAAHLIHVAQESGKETVITLLAPQAVAMTPPPAPVITVLSTREGKKQNPEQNINKNKFCSFQGEEKEKQEFCSPTRGNNFNADSDETSAWTKPPVAWTAARPDTSLAAAALTPEAYTTLYHEAEVALIAEGVKAFCLTMPVIEARMSLLLEQAAAPHERLAVPPGAGAQQARVIPLMGSATLGPSSKEPCPHEHIHESGACNDCGMVVASAAGD